jgi:hypothetical protein
LIKNASKMDFFKGMNAVLLSKEDQTVPNSFGYSARIYSTQKPLNQAKSIRVASLLCIELACMALTRGYFQPLLIPSKDSKERSVSPRV